MDSIKPKDWDALNEALQKIAKAQNAMRRRLVALEEELRNALPALAEMAVEASASTSEPSPGVFIPDPNCKVCRKAKTPGRYQLTCRECGSARAAIFRTEGADRTSILFSVCVNCNTPKKAHTMMLCTPCSGAFKEWKRAEGKS